MKTREELEKGLSDHIQKYGEWVYDIPLPHGLWTRGNQRLPHTRLKKLLQIASDTSLKPISECRVLDLGCLDGLFSIEFALQGSSVLGIEIREANLKKAEFAREALDLVNLNFIQDDVRNISVEKYGMFDVIICSGLFYHLTNPDVFVFAEKMFEMSNRLVIIDTHVSLNPSETVSHKGKIYHGQYYEEHGAADSLEKKEKRKMASAGNDMSFLFSRPSLVNLLAHVGFSSAYEAFNPPHLNFGKPGLEHVNRCTFLAIKGQKSELLSSPIANNLEEDLPEESLTYAHQPEPTTLVGPVVSSIKKAKHAISKIF